MLDAVVGGSLSHISDALGDQTRPTLGRRLSEHGFLSALSVPLGAGPDGTADGVATGLNLYSEPANAFDPVAVRMMAALLAAHAGMALVETSSAARAANLERALRTNKAIGPAIGLIMARHQLSHDQSMNLLRKISQRINRKVSDLAAAVVEVGALRQSVGSLTCSGR